MQHPRPTKFKFLSKEPSKELLNLIKEVGQVATKLAELIETIKQKGYEEGFTNDELRDLLKTHLRGILTRGQINWYLYEKDKMNLRKQLVISGQIEGNNLIEQPSEQELQSGAQAEREVRLKGKKQENDNNSSPEHLKATIKDQLEYINKLEDILQEKLEIKSAQSQRVRVPVSQLYRDIVMLRNSGATDIYIIIDDGKYVGLERI
jgi:hypothetical protein